MKIVFVSGIEPRNLVEVGLVHGVGQVAVFPVKPDELVPVLPLLLMPEAERMHELLQERTRYSKTKSETRQQTYTNMLRNAVLCTVRSQIELLRADGQFLTGENCYRNARIVRYSARANIT